MAERWGVTEQTTGVDTRELLEEAIRRVKVERRSLKRLAKDDDDSARHFRWARRRLADARDGLSDALADYEQAGAARLDGWAAIEEE